MNLYLVGYRCCGKTSLGKALADRLKWAFVDTDRQVQENTGMDISRIVEREGWQGFRLRERRVIERLAQFDQQVVATGGGAVLDRRNVAAMRSSGKVVWLKASAEVIVRRMNADPDTAAMRPALTGLDIRSEIITTLEQRRPLYNAAAHWELDTDNTGVDSLCRQLLKYLEGH